MLGVFPILMMLILMWNFTLFFLYLLLLLHLLRLLLLLPLLILLLKSMTCFSANCVFACIEVFCFDLISLAKKNKKLKCFYFLKIPFTQNWFPYPNQFLLPNIVQRIKGNWKKKLIYSSLWKGKKIKKKKKNLPKSKKNLLERQKYSKWLIKKR